MAGTSLSKGVPRAASAALRAVDSASSNRPAAAYATASVSSTSGWPPPTSATACRARASASDGDRSAASGAAARSQARPTSAGGIRGFRSRARR